MIAVGVFWLFAPIGVTPHRFPPEPNGIYSKKNAEDQHIITSLNQYPYCAISTVSLESETLEVAPNKSTHKPSVDTSPSHCELLEKDGNWVITVTGEMTCKVTCFKAYFSE
jgi:hypothetical protein